MNRSNYEINLYLFHSWMRSHICRLSQKVMADQRELLEKVFIYIGKGTSS